MAPYIPVKKGTDVGPQTGQPVYGERRGGPDAGAPGADSAVEQNRASINAWVAGQRQAYANSTVPYQTGVFSHPDFDVRYQNSQGSERVTVSPKLKPEPAPPGAGPEPALPTSAPNDLPALVGDTHDDTPKCLMVLYTQLNRQTQKLEGYVAAVDMDGLETPNVRYQGAAQKSQWVPATGRLLPTMQIKIGETGWVMLPLDLTGQAAAKAFYLSTTELGDAVATRGDVSGMPLLNGAGPQIYTNGGSFLSTQQGLTLVATPHREAGGVTQVPHAITASGTCYFLPVQNGDIAVGTSFLTTPVFDPQHRSTETRDAVNDKLSKVALAETTTGFAGVIYKSKTDYRYDEQSTLNFDDYTTINHTTGQCIFYDKLKATIVAYSYYFSAPYGKAAQLQNLMVSEGTMAANSYTGGETGYVIARAEGTSNLLDNFFPLMDYTGGSTDSLSVNMVKYTSNQLTKNDLQYDMTKKPVVMAGLSTGWNATGVRVGSLPSHSYTQASYEVDGQIDNPPPTKNATDGDLADAWAQARAYVTSNGGTISDVANTPLVLNTHNHDLTVTVDGSGDGTDTSADGSGQADWPDDKIMASVGYSSPGGGSGYFAVYSSLHFPKSYPVTPSYTSNSVTTILGETLQTTFDQTGGEPPIAALAVHAFPPMLRGKGWYTKTTGTIAHQVYTTITPYGRYENVSQNPPSDAFAPWLHVSNGKHALQGYYVGGKGYLFLDGGTNNYLPVLARAIGCDPQDIATMVMDVTLKKIKAVAGVRPPDYSGSAAGDPGVIAHD